MALANVYKKLAKAEEDIVEGRCWKEEVFKKLRKKYGQQDEI